MREIAIEKCSMREFVAHTYTYKYKYISNSLMRNDIIYVALCQL